MVEIPSIGPGSVGPINRASERIEAYRVSENRPQQSEPLGDRVELSPQAVLLDRLLQLPDVRGDLVEQVREAITSGTYETEAKLNAAIDGLLRDEADWDRVLGSV